MLNDRDLWRLSDAIKSLYAQPGIDRPVWSAVDSIQDLIDCDWGVGDPGVPSIHVAHADLVPVQQGPGTSRRDVQRLDRHPNWRAFVGRPPSAGDRVAPAFPRRGTRRRCRSTTRSSSHCRSQTCCGRCRESVHVRRQRDPDRARPYSARDGLVLEVLSGSAARGRGAHVARHRSAGGEAGLLRTSSNSWPSIPGNVVDQSLGAGAALNRFFPPPGVHGELPAAVQTWLAAEPPDPVLCVATDGRSSNCGDSTLGCAPAPAWCCTRKMGRRRLAAADRADTS